MIGAEVSASDKLLLLDLALRVYLHHNLLRRFSQSLGGATAARKSNTYTMSSFKRRSTKQNPTPVGTRIQPGSISTFISSTGIPSLDDILGGGLPLTCSQLILAPDIHSAYGELVQKYFVAQGLASGQNVCILSEQAQGFLEGCMWLPGSSTTTAFAVASPIKVEDEEDETAQDHDAKIKIAWRYEQMKQFQTTVSSSNQYVVSFNFVRGM